MKASQIYNTTQASNSQQVLLYSNRSAVIIVLVRESSTEAPSRERERENNDEPQQHTCKERRRSRRSATDGSFAMRTRSSGQRDEVLNVLFTKLPTFLLEAPNVLFSKLPTFVLEAPNVLSRSFQRSFSTLPGFYFHIFILVQLLLPIDGWFIIHCLNLFNALLHPNHFSSIQ